MVMFRIKAKMCCMISLVSLGMLFQSPLVAATSQKGTAKNPVSQFTSWKLSGAMAAKKGKKGWTAVLVWNQQGKNHYQIRLIGPLGGGNILIERNNNRIVYHEGAKHVTSRQADELFQRQTGIRLPVDALYYWVRGIPSPGRVTRVVDDGEGHLIQLRQLGYQLDFSRYVRVGGVDLPGKINLQGHDMSMKLVIKHWAS